MNNKGNNTLIKIVEYTQEHETAYSEFVERSPKATLAHHLGFRKAIETGLGHRSCYRIALEGSTVRGVLPLFAVQTWWRSRYLISLPWLDYGGLCAESLEAEKMLLEEAGRLAKQEKAEFVEFRSTKAIDHDLAPRDDKVTFILDLDKDSDVVWKRLNDDVRRHIKKSRKSGLTTEFGGAEKLDEFYKIFCWKMRDLGTPVWGYKFYQSILEHFGKSAQFILVRKEGKVLAGALVMSFKDTLFAPSVASYRPALNLRPNHALYWAIIEKGCNEGFKHLDFGRSTIDSGTYNFKLRWVPTPTPLQWQYLLNQAREVPAISPHNPKYRLMINMWRKLPLPVANYLGPKVIKNFP